MPAKKIPSRHKGMTVAQIMFGKDQVKPDGAAINLTTVVHSAREGQRNYGIQAHLNEKNFRGNDVTRVELPKDTKNSQAMRDAEWLRQSSMPWGSRLMITSTDAQRLNNPAQTAAMRQKQLAPPSSYGQFYAFMHAMSAAFGSIKQ